jgi:hypothetical protein
MGHPTKPHSNDRLTAILRNCIIPRFVGATGWLSVWTLSKGAALAH